MSKDEKSEATSDRIKKFCMDFPSDKELREFGLIHMEETTLGVSDWSKRQSSINDLGPSAALQLAILDLDGALHIGNYVEIADIVWFLGSSGLLGRELAVEESISIMFSDARVMLVAIASIYCARLGGCASTHPVTLSLCFQLSERQCYYPDSVQHAAEQLLTGRELLAYYHMHQGIISLVSQHRRGEF